MEFIEKVRLEIVAGRLVKRNARCGADASREDVYELFAGRVGLVHRRFDHRRAEHSDENGDEEGNEEQHEHGDELALVQRVQTHLHRSKSHRGIARD